MGSGKKKVRVDLRKNRAKPPRENDITRAFKADAAATGDAAGGERVRAKGDLSRKRTLTVDTAADGMPAADAACVRGRVLRVHGLASVVEADDGRVFRCAVRRLLKSLSVDERSVVTTGDVVWFRPVVSNSEVEIGGAPRAAAAEPLTADVGEEAPSPDADPGAAQIPTSKFQPTPEGMIERVEPRRGVLTRASRRREHVLVANVDQLAIVISLVLPDLKPHLIDRYLAAAQKGGLAPVLLLNKADLADPVALQPLVGFYSQLGIPTILTSAATGLGVGRLRELLRGRATVFSGQSGVGKSSLLNSVQPGLALKVKSVSEVNEKGRHTTTYAQLIRLDAGGWVVDTPGVRTLALWDTSPEEVEGYFPEFRPFVPGCAFPDCTHTHETGCAVKAAVARRQLSERRYHSYIGMFRGAGEE
ncbi:ribosome small subunit-dependent GTPase A [Urbifossiella limnaea]|uniref:Small ribosomal subunit biogenesis GTPase RsgA n=1 Tax=Urbifossiella limnaea TaxID=2528023 RepID=A0A517Y3N0_9BACT|nr:ribosome small subunit-dependent GTPase A [Urbifossiella limnaea]QDU24332.1 Putative ribosome biogenesis GTPase RsgA [Urbifossiella limnaea]